MFPKVVQVVPMKDYTVYVYFEDGKIVCYDMKNMLDKEVFKPLKDISVFTDTCYLPPFFHRLFILIHFFVCALHGVVQGVVEVRVEAGVAAGDRHVQLVVIRDVESEHMLVNGSA